MKSYPPDLLPDISKVKSFSVKLVMIASENVIIRLLSLVTVRDHTGPAESSSHPELVSSYRSLQSQSYVEVFKVAKDAHS
jgi:hypothetical protein